MTQNKKLAIFEGISGLCAILAFVFCFLPAYFEEGKEDQSIFHMAGVKPVLWIGLILLLVAGIASLLLAFLLFKDKIDHKKTMVIAIISGLSCLVAGILLSLSLFVCGYHKANSELGFTQGVWGVKIGTILVAIMSLASFVLSYPSALVVLHDLDMKDHEKKKEIAK